VAAFFSGAEGSVRPGGSGALSRGWRLRERRHGDWHRVMRGNEGHRTPVHLVHSREEEGDARRLLVWQHGELRPAASDSMNGGRGRPSLVGWFGPRWPRRLGRFQWKQRRMKWATPGRFGPKKRMGFRTVFQFFEQSFEFKSQGFKHF
jgi:hypothetical protein